ncbi:type IA DNA topoisomerase [Pseudomonas sp. WS 5532]|uniref:toprim domain-containing protein n=1 Tax=Pseudomonas sp. WS 5532 TaxID=2717495 RepID=UPI0014745B7C|nr:toprim domain-containing protein [Pseudomonas sp. WS 5532]NMX77837.1 type IA DNA topoisomerase [Pseudomonas sp. WS 5532]
MNRDLVIIEAVGKIRPLRAIFEEVGLKADLCATIGHILEAPQDLRQLGIKYQNGEFVEFNRRPLRSDSFDYLCRSIQSCKGRILIATDNDQDGHVIASDVLSVAEQIGNKQPIYRMLFSGINRESVLHALGRLQPVDSLLAQPGTARRILDRLIGGCLSDFDAHLPVGRVQTALLEIANEGLAHSYINVQMQAVDGGRNFHARVPINGAVSPAELIAQLKMDDLPAAPVLDSVPARLADPMNYGDALLAIQGGVGLALEDAAGLLQEMYEQGDISYHRTTTRAFTSASCEVMQRMARIKGITAFRHSALPMVDAVGESVVPHEAIHVLNEKLLQRLDLGKPPALQGSHREAALVILARRSLESGIVVSRETPDLARSPAWTQELIWTRDSRKPSLPWMTPAAPAVVSVDPKAELVTEMMRRGIGRPSTWPTHASRFVERGLLDSNHELSEKGRRLLAAAPPGLRNLLCSERIEEILERDDVTVSQMVNGALEVALAGDHERAAALIQQIQEQFEDAEELERHYRPSI